MRRRRARGVDTKVRIITHDVDEFKGMRPFHVNRFGRVTGHTVMNKKITTYTIVTDAGSEFKLTRDQFATSALERSYRYQSTKK